MIRQYEFCPKCQGVRLMSMSISICRVTTVVGKIKESLILNYHCETCNSFVRSTPMIGEDDFGRVGHMEFQAAMPRT